MKIEVGMLVEILEGNPIHPEARKEVGLRGRVLSEYFGEGDDECSRIEGERYFDVEGSDFYNAERILRPILPDNQPAEEGFQEDLKLWLKGKVSA